MKTYKQLTKDQQTKALSASTVSIIKFITEQPEHNISFAFPDLEGRIKEAAEKAEANQTPWFFSEFLMKTCEKELRGTALADAERTLYTEAGEHVVGGIA